jgi:hypothetical protein
LVKKNKNLRNKTKKKDNFIEQNFDLDYKNIYKFFSGQCDSIKGKKQLSPYLMVNNSSKYQFKLNLYQQYVYNKIKKNSKKIKNINKKC